MGAIDSVGEGARGAWAGEAVVNSKVGADMAGAGVGAGARDVEGESEGARERVRGRREKASRDRPRARQVERRLGPLCVASRPVPSQLACERASSMSCVPCQQPSHT